MEHQLIVESDLEDYLSKKENINTFINFCIRERMKAEINMSMRKIRRPSLEVRENNHLDSETLKPLSAEEVENPNTPFFGQKIVITGQLSRFLTSKSSFTTAMLFLLSRAPVGSSQRSKSGLLTTALATETRCCSPPES